MRLSLLRPALDELEKRYRANLINSLAGYKSANLLGSVNGNGQTNLALMSSVFHIGANPPLVGMLFRPHSVPRHSLENLKELGEFTLNVVTGDMHKQAHQSTARYDREQSEFAAVGLDEEYSEAVKAPYVAQSPIKTGLKLVETQTLNVNDTVLVIGEIVELRINENLISDDGQLDLNAANAVAISGLDEYHLAESLGRLAYPKP
jgi:flavin reductase (DIM6/NTAB) family NADH-FMN oxidoreductase RutF